VSDLQLFAVMPVYNEAPSIAAVVEEWMEAFARADIRFRLMAINDGSTDETLVILKMLQERYDGRLAVLDKKNSGHGRTCRLGYETALQQGAPWILQIDSDGQCDPTFFPQFLSLRDEADCIFGLRVVRDDGISRRLISVACRMLASVVTTRDLKDANVPYRLIKSDVLRRALHIIPPDFDLQNIALTLALRRDASLRWAYVPIRFRKRAGGSASINFANIIRMGTRMLFEIRRVK
jgi:dolichol-phosphate mannosyltransferase